MDGTGGGFILNSVPSSIPLSEPRQGSPGVGWGPVPGGAVHCAEKQFYLCSVQADGMMKAAQRAPRAWARHRVGQRREAPTLQRLRSPESSHVPHPLSACSGGFVATWLRW